MIVDRPASPQTQLVMGQIGVARSHPDYVAIELMNTLLGGMFSSRINTNLREVHGYTYGSRSRFSYRRSRGLLQSLRQFGPMPPRQQLPKFLVRSPGCARRLRRLKNWRLQRSTTLGPWFLVFKRLGSSAASVGELFVHRLERDEYRKVVDKIAATTLEDVQRVAKYLDPGSFVIVAAGDAAKIENELRALDLGPVSVVRPQEAEHLT